jgi:hypothetical protein
VAEGTRWARRPDPPRFNAAKEGGFMGFGAAQVSKGEKEIWTRCARRSHKLNRARSQVDPLEAHIGN